MTDVEPDGQKIQMKENYKKKQRRENDALQNSKKGTGQILSSKIYNPSLSIMSHLIQYSILASAVVAFLVGAVAFAL